MNRLYKPFLIVTYLLLFGAFTSTSLGQTPNTGDVNVAITTTFSVPSGLAPATLTDGAVYGLYVLNSAGNSTISPGFAITYDNINGNTGSAVALINYQDYQWGIWVNGANPISDPPAYGPFTFTTIGPTITLTGGGGSIAENGGNTDLTVTASAAIGKNLAVTVTYTGTTSNVYGTDFTNTGGADPETITITAGNLAATTTITGVADLLFEGDETIIGTITALASGVIGGGAQTITITDAERISILRSSSQVLEGATVRYYAEVRDDGGGSVNGATVANGDVTVTVDWSTGTAIPGTDFTGQGNITISDGTSSASVLMTATDDSYLEGDETLIGEITALTYGAIGTSTNQTTITDGESLILSGGTTITEAATATLTATVSGGGTLKLNGGGSLSITLTYTGTATRPGDYNNSGSANPETLTLNDGAASVSTTITPVNDATIELDETAIAAMTTGVTGLTVSGSPQTVTITDDNETVLLSPINAATGQDLNVTLSWSAVAGADQYKLYVNTDNGFGSGTAILDGVDKGNVTSFAPGGLSDNVQYFWKVVPRNIATSDTRAASNTEIRSFTTTQQSVTGALPADNSLGVELFPTLSWPAGPTGTDKYRLEVNTASGFNGTVIYDNATLTSTSKQIAGLSNGTKYYWRVTASSNLAKVNTSSVLNFTTSTDKYVTLTYPKSGETVVTLIPTLYWSVSNSVSGLTYEYQINTVNTFTNSSPTPIASSSTSATTSTLASGQTYYWRVRSKTSGGVYSQWSSVGSFVTQTGLSASPAATLSWPVGNPTLLDATPTLNWYLSGVAPAGATINYTIQVTSVSGDYNSPVWKIYDVTTLSTTVTTTLAAGTKYYWRVWTVNDTAGDSTVSSEDSFTIDLGQGGAPASVLSWPISNATVYSITPTLYWYLSSPATGSVTYDIEVNDDATFANATEFSSSGQSPQFVLVNPGTPLTAGTTYYWRVKTHNGSNSSSWVSTNGKFTIASTIASAPDPVLSWPVGGATVYSTTPVLYWYLAGPPPSGATITYDIKVDNNSDFSSPEASTTANSTQSWTVGTALSPGTYYWQVNVNNTTASTSSTYKPATGTSANSFVVAANASGAGVAPTPIYPTGNVTVSTLTPTLSWFVNGVVPSSGTTYEVELKPTSLDFDGAGLVTGITSSNTVTVTLSPGTQYHWRVRIRNTSLTPNPSAWSDPVVTGGAKFTTASTLAPPPPLVGDPINGVTVSNTTPEISWFLPTAPKGALKYRLQISEDRSMNNITVQLDDINAFHTVVNTLKGGTTYYWRVQSKDSKGEYSAHSNVGRFSTATVTAVENELVIPTKFTVEQNYPNPFNPTTIIRFALPEASFVTLKIYNMLGQEVKTLVNGQKDAGTFNVQWRGDNDFGRKVSSGTYIYRVIAGPHIVTKKMILLK